MRILTYITTEEDAGRAARSVVPRRFQLGTHAFRRLKVEGGILCDGAPLRADTVLRAGQRLEIRMDNGETETKAETKTEIEAALDGLPPSFIRYIDEDMLVVSKGAPLATLPCGHIHTGTLREQLAALLGQDAAAFDYHPVNRLRPAVRRPPCPRPAPADRPASHGQLHPRIPRRDRGRSRAARGRDRRADCPPRHGRKTRGSPRRSARRDALPRRAGRRRPRAHPPAAGDRAHPSDSRASGAYRLPDLRRLPLWPRTAGTERPLRAPFRAPALCPARHGQNGGGRRAAAGRTKSAFNAFRVLCGICFIRSCRNLRLKYLPLRGRWHDEVVTEGVRSTPKP